MIADEEELNLHFYGQETRTTKIIGGCNWSVFCFDDSSNCIYGDLIVSLFWISGYFQKPRSPIPLSNSPGIWMCVEPTSYSPIVQPRRHCWWSQRLDIFVEF